MDRLNSPQIYRVVAHPIPYHAYDFFRSELVHVICMDQFEPNVLVMFDQFRTLIKPL